MSSQTSSGMNKLSAPSSRDVSDEMGTVSTDSCKCWKSKLPFETENLTNNSIMDSSNSSYGPCRSPRELESSIYTEPLSHCCNQTSQASCEQKGSTCKRSTISCSQAEKPPPESVCLSCTSLYSGCCPHRRMISSGLNTTGSSTTTTTCSCSESTKLSDGRSIQTPYLRKGLNAASNKNKEVPCYTKVWLKYLEEKVTKCSCVDEAAVCTTKGDIIARVDMLYLSREEVLKIVECLRRPQDTYKTGIMVNGRLYMYLSGSTNILRGTTLEGDVGIIVTKAKNHLLIGTSRNVEHLGECDFVLDKQTSYLEMVGY